VTIVSSTVHPLEELGVVERRERRVLGAEVHERPRVVRGSA
jgi:hypothetical protein